jgi:hypothetical protein
VKETSELLQSLPEGEFLPPAGGQRHEIRLAFHQTLQEHIKKAFDLHTPLEQLQDADAQALIVAREELRKFSSPKTKTMQPLLLTPIDPTTPIKGKEKKSNSVQQTKKEKQP